MSVTTTKVRTVADALNDANPNDIADALRMLTMGDQASVIEEDSGVIAGAATYKLQRQAASIESVRVVSNTGGTFVGLYEVTGDAGATGLTAATSSVVGLCKLGTDKQTLTFPAADITRVVVRYRPLIRGKLLTDAFLRS